MLRLRSHCDDADVGKSGDGARMGHRLRCVVASEAERCGCRELHNRVRHMLAAGLTAACVQRARGVDQGGQCLAHGDDAGVRARSERDELALEELLRPAERGARGRARQRQPARREPLSQGRLHGRAHAPRDTAAEDAPHAVGARDVEHGHEAEHAHEQLERQDPDGRASVLATRVSACAPLAAGAALVRSACTLGALGRHALGRQDRAPQRGVGLVQALIRQVTRDGGRLDLGARSDLGIVSAVLNGCAERHVRPGQARARRVLRACRLVHRRLRACLHLAIRARRPPTNRAHCRLIVIRER